MQQGRVFRAILINDHFMKQNQKLLNKIICRIGLCVYARKKLLIDAINVYIAPPKLLKQHVIELI